MSNTFLKTSDPNKASVLQSLGFSFIKEFRGQTLIYVFLLTPELKAYVEQNYSSSDFTYDNHLCF